MNVKKSERALLLEHFPPNTPVLVVHGSSSMPDWSHMARLGDLTESLIPQRDRTSEHEQTGVGLVIAAPIGLNLPGRLIDIVTFGPGAPSFVELGLASYSRVRAEAAASGTDAVDEQRHQDLMSRLLFRPEV